MTDTLDRGKTPQTLSDHDRDHLALRSALATARARMRTDEGRRITRAVDLIAQHLLAEWTWDEVIAEREGQR